MSAYGYEIVQTLIVDIEPDVNVKRAMNEINAGMYKLHFPFYPWLRSTVWIYIIHLEQFYVFHERHSSFFFFFS
jgi:hypothetical protein